MNKDWKQNSTPPPTRLSKTCLIAVCLLKPDTILHRKTCRTRSPVLMPNSMSLAPDFLPVSSPNSVTLPVLLGRQPAILNWAISSIRVPTPHRQTSPSTTSSRTLVITFALKSQGRYLILPDSQLSEALAKVPEIQHTIRRQLLASPR